MAEGISGSTAPMQDMASGVERSLLTSLCEEGHQSVTVTGAYKKKVDLMFLPANPAIRFLDDVVTARAPADRTIKWSARFLVEKAADRHEPNEHAEH